MPILKNKYFPYLLLLLLSVPLFFLNIRDVHGWGDDFSQYIKEAQNIAHGKPYYQSGYIYNPHNPEYAPAQYPPGYPILLAPIVKVWGLAIRPMLYFNTVIATCLLLALFAYFRKHTSVVTAICIAVAITYSGIMIDLKGNILSDSACLLFVTLYLTTRNAKSFPPWRILLLIFLLIIAVFTRTQAILLMAAEAIYLFISILKDIIQKKRFSAKELLAYPSLSIIGGGMVINFVLNKFVFNAPISTSSFYNHFIDQAIHGNLKEIAEAKINQLLTDISTFFHYNTYSGFPSAGVVFIQDMALVFGITGFIIRIAKRVAVDDLFFVLMCLLVIYLPVHDQRYFLPIIPLLFFYCYTTFKALLPAITKVDGRWVGVILTLVYLRIGYGELKSAATEVPPGCIPQEKELKAFSYISQHVGDNDIIVFTLPRVLTLYTNKKSVVSAWQIPHEQNKRIFDSLNVKYLLTVDGLGDGYYRDYMRHVEHPIDSVRIADGYTLYSLR